MGGIFLGKGMGLELSNELSKRDDVPVFPFLLEDEEFPGKPIGPRRGARPGMMPSSSCWRAVSSSRSSRSIGRIVEKKPSSLHGRTRTGIKARSSPVGERPKATA